MRSIILSILLLIFTEIINSQPRVDISLNFADGSGETRTRNVGLDSLATTGVDAAFGEEALPPMPPGFEVRFDLSPFGIPNQVYKDYRNASSFPFSDTLEHRLVWQYSAGATGFTISYNLPAGVQLRIQDVFTPNGLLFNSGVLSDSGSYSIPNAVSSGFTSAKLFIMYLDVIPVELTSFYATINTNKITLIWQTSTELNNLGFDIECKIDKGNWEKIGYIAGNGTSTNPHNYSFTFDLNKPGSKYLVRLKQIDFNGTFTYSQIVNLNTTKLEEYELKQNFPNPFNPATTISFSTPIKGNVKLMIFNQIGQLVDELVNKVLDAGSYNFRWNAKNMSSGIYYYKIQAENFNSIKKMTLIK